MKSILDRSFRYTPSTSTDLKKTFARVRREQRQQGQVQPVLSDVELKTNVLPIKQRRSGTAELT